jgi:beta-glucanase (GH16 family)
MKAKTYCVSLGLALGFCVISSAQIATLNPQASSWDGVPTGEPLDLTGYDLTFSDDFNTNSITPDGGAGPWYAPVHSSYGVAKFDTPGAGNQTYSVSGGILTIRATKEADGWHGGNIETVNTPGKGFAQRFGYFEARMKFPNMTGAWPGFWLKSQEEHTNPSMVRPEIDIVEWYGGDPRGLHSTVHLWPPASQYILPGGLTQHWFKSNYQSEPGLAGEWHTYGALISPQFVVIYLDRKEIAKFPTFDEFKVALYPLVSLTLYPQDAAKAVSPFELQVDYVRVYAPHIPNPPADVHAK